VEGWCETMSKQLNKVAKQGASFGTEATSERVKGSSFENTAAVHICSVTYAVVTTN